MKKPNNRFKYDNKTLHVMMIPGVILLFIYSYIPMFGLVMAFQDYIPALGISGSEWVGVRNFTFLFGMLEFGRALRNTVFIAICKIVLGIFVPVVFALLLNEVRAALVQKGIQTLVYLPHFISWVLLAGIVRDIFSPTTGIVNTIIESMGGEAVFFLGDNRAFPWLIIFADIWKEFGYGTIIYLAALTGIDPTLYEVATVDGANRWKQLVHITLPGIAPIIVLMTTLSMGNVLNAGFDEIFNLYSPAVYASGDILDTLLYRLGLVSMQYSVSTAAGLIKSVVSMLLIITSYRIAYITTGYKVF
jgi:putative aldouronate transport system permease protein